jgi:hypothetical protein
MESTVLLDTLVRPTGAISEGATAVHGLTDANVAEAPTFSEIYPALAESVRGKVVIAFNADFDERILRLLLPASPSWEVAMSFSPADTLSTLQIRYKTRFATIIDPTLYPTLHACQTAIGIRVRDFETSLTVMVTDTSNGDLVEVLHYPKKDLPLDDLFLYS